MTQSQFAVTQHKKAHAFTWSSFPHTAIMTALNQQSLPKAKKILSAIHDFSQVPARNATPMTVQTKLTIGQPNDKFEQEADHIANQVMSMPDPRVQRQDVAEEEEEPTIQPKTLADQITPLVQRQIEPDEKEEEPDQLTPNSNLQCQRQQTELEEDEEKISVMQAKRKNGQIPQASLSVEGQIRSLRGSSQPLPQSVRNFFEPRFGYDFSNVRINRDIQSEEMAMRLRADAFTVGQTIVFGVGQYAPGTMRGNELLAHELTHVIQQSRNPIDHSEDILCNMRRRRQRIPRRVPRFRATIVPHVVTQDPSIIGGAGIHSRTLEEFKNRIRVRRDRRPWSLWLTIHGWNNVVAYRNACVPRRNCITAQMFQRLFSDRAWLQWRNRFGPTRVVLHACYLTNAMTRTIENSLRRRRTQRTQPGLGQRCHHIRDFISIRVPMRGPWIRTRQQYVGLNFANKRDFLRRLRTFRPMGYGDVDTRRMNDRRLLHYYFTEPIPGTWLQWQIEFRPPRGQGWRIPRFRFTRGSRYARQCP